jgi:hypothetical protein
LVRTIGRGGREVTLVHLAWDASADPATIGYIIRAGTQSRNYTLANDVGNVLDGAIDLPTVGRWFSAIASYDAARTETLGEEPALFVAPADVVISPYVASRFVMRQ